MIEYYSPGVWSVCASGPLRLGDVISPVIIGSLSDRYSMKVAFLTMARLKVIRSVNRLYEGSFIDLPEVSTYSGKSISNQLGAKMLD